jgi:hypothetical protein
MEEWKIVAVSAFVIDVRSHNWSDKPPTMKRSQPLVVPQQVYLPAIIV